MTDLLNIELVSDIVKKLDRADEEALMMLRKNLKKPFWKDFTFESWRTRRFMRNAIALYHSDQVHDKESKSYSKLRAIVSNVFKDHHQNSVMAQKTKRPGDKQSDPSEK